MTVPPSVPSSLTGEKSVLRLTFDGPLAVLSMDSAPMNLFDEAMWGAWADAVEWLTAHPPRALLVRAEGRVVSAGVDVRVFADLDPADAESFWRTKLGVTQALEALPCPTVFAAHSLTLTAAFELALACDLVVATAQARFGLVERKIAFTPSMGGTQRLALRAGPSRARELVMTGDLYRGSVLADWGVVNALLPQASERAPAGEAPFAHRAAGFAVPLREAAAADPGGPLDELLARNAATVPAYGHDLNTAGALHLTATSLGSDGPRAAVLEPVERPDTTREFDAFTAAAGHACVLGLVGDPGTGRTTELAALAARRARGAAPAPTLWLRGADLRADDASVADAVARALDRAGRILAASEETPADSGPGDISAARVARVARDAGRPLLLLLDGPEEMPPALAHRLAGWSDGTAAWLREVGARLVVACRAEYWEQAGAYFDAASLHGTGTGCGDGLPGCVRLGDLPAPQAARARARYGIPEGTLAAADARHPLALRLLWEVRAALPDAPPPGGPDRAEIFAAHLDLQCLRVAVRLAAANGLRGTAVRRLAARVSGQLHEAARRCLGPGQGELDRAAFEEVFPWGALPGKGFDTCTGWASAVLTEGLLVPAGSGYRFAHEELADWIQGLHLDVDGALSSLIHRHRPPGPLPRGPRPLPVPRHRAGPVIQALLSLERQRGAAELAARLGELVDALGEFRDGEPGAPAGSEGSDGKWWAGRLLTEVLSRVGDATPYLGVLGVLADRGEFGTGFWLGLPLGEAARFDLLRRLVVRDGPPGTPDRCLDAVAELLAEDPAGVQPQLAGWFADERPLDAAPDATVASAAQALLYTHRHRAIDDLTEALVRCANARADELLAALAEEEPSAVCRAVDRWAHDERPARRVAAVAYGLRAAPHTVTEADRELLRYAAFALLARPVDDTLHGAALALLVRDPHTRSRHLPRALRHFADGDPQLPASALAEAIATHPEPVLAAFRARLHAPGRAADDVLRSLADVTTPTLARRVATLVHDLLEARPEAAGPAASYIDRRLEQGPGVRAVLFPLVAGLLHSRPAQVRAALAPVLAASGTAASRELRGELLDVLLSQERDCAVLESVLRSVVRGLPECGEVRTRARVHRTALLLVRTPEGAVCFDRRLVELARSEPGFAALVTRWIGAAPQEWAALVGPSARRTLGGLAGGDRVPA
ncbi:enoyl-CoA hydratase/isomerase family protein [Streptomyces kanamyceticus]|uniref:enoyl-CoA hydratase/isomerase family protein n=1 Tax=Streptomyces kanamyceticus TaxID=1967 RepID=UPI0006E1C1A2|nr:enoyl-CoA hydratase/isomerase family protein [Streptomyces kanamyceticus]